MLCEYFKFLGPSSSKSLIFNHDTSLFVLYYDLLQFFVMIGSISLHIKIPTRKITKIFSNACWLPSRNCVFKNLTPFAQKCI